MFIRIESKRIKISSIGEYEVKGKSIHTGKFYLDIKISGKIMSFTFDTEKRLNSVVEYLDRVLKVQEV